MIRLGNQKLIPKLHIMNLVAKDEQGQAYLFLYIGIHPNRQDAYVAALQKMKKNVPDLYEVGNTGEGFTIAGHRAYSQSQLQANFRKEIDKHNPPPIKIAVVENSEKDSLIEKIIKKGSQKYLDKHADKLNEFEVAYIRDKIITGE